MEDGGVVPDLDGEMEDQQLGEMTTLKSARYVPRRKMAEMEAFQISEGRWCCS